MKIKLLISLFFSSTFLFSLQSISSENSEVDKKLIPATKLTYVEREPGVEDYRVSMIVSDRYIRVDEIEEESGYIVYDDKEKTIYSVGHNDKSVLVINSEKIATKKSPVNSFVEYLPLVGAPKVAEKQVFNYRVYTKQDNTHATKKNEVSCMEIQLAEGLFPRVRKLLQNYQKVISSQQVKMVDNVVNDIQTPCYYVDQVYNEGDYYEKGLPIQEWHSNDKLKALTSYKAIEVEADLFKIPEEYKQFSVGEDSKRPF